MKKMKIMGPIEAVVAPAGSKEVTAGRIYLPKTWVGKTVIVYLKSSLTGSTKGGDTK